MHDQQARVLEIYREVDEIISAFAGCTGISCVSGCGECCRRFEPFISVLEAGIIADHIMTHPQAFQIFTQAPRDKREVLCPFFDPDRPYHCGMYALRPLICRLFAFSARRVPDVLYYEACKAIRQQHVQKVELANQLIRQGLAIPIYHDVYLRLQKIDFWLATDQHPLTRSIEIALEKQNQIACGEYQQAHLQHPDSQSLAVPFSKWLRQHLETAALKTK